MKNYISQGRESHKGIDLEFPISEDRTVEETSKDDNREGRSESIGHLELFEGMEFESEESAKTFYEAYAKRIGFGIRAISISKRGEPNSFRQFMCIKGNFRFKKDPSEEHECKRPRSISRGCKASMCIEKQDSGGWAVVKVEKEHNHIILTPTKTYSLRERRPLSNTEDSHHGNTQQNHNSKEESQRSNNDGFHLRDSEYLMDYFKQKQAQNSRFFYHIQVNENNKLCNVFWIDERSRDSYNYFGDVVVFDVTYKTNQNKFPFAQFKGMNHHMQPIVFGCALLVDESESTFIWLYNTWLEAVSGRHPLSIVIDYEKTLKEAVPEVLPYTFLRFSHWDILKKSSEHLAHIYGKHPKFHKGFHKCILQSETIDEFESGWDSLLESYNLKKNPWLEELYDCRSQWVPAYIKRGFYAEFISNQPLKGGVNSLFEKSVTLKTSVKDFIDQYELWLDEQYNLEEKSDNETNETKPTMKTTSPMEKQVGEIYTRKIFAEFQQELLETFSCVAKKSEGIGATTIYRVSKFGEEERSYTVRFNRNEMMATCTCGMFEFSGILCRHILTVFIISNVFMIPSHFILKRWSKYAKSEATWDEYGSITQNNRQEPQTIVYDNVFIHDNIIRTSQIGHLFAGNTQKDTMGEASWAYSSPSQLTLGLDTKQ